MSLKLVSNTDLPLTRPTLTELKAKVERLSAENTQLKRELLEAEAYIGYLTIKLNEPSYCSVRPPG